LSAPAILVVVSLPLLATAATAQSRLEPAAADTVGTSVEQARAPSQAPARRAASPAGSFARGHKRVSVYGGAGSTLGQTYALIGGGVGYFLANGLEAGVSFEGWILNSPTIWKLTPQLNYIVWQSPRFKPYAGAFWRRTYIGGDFPDYDSWGGRGGVYYSSGRGYAGIGVVYEKFLDCDDAYDDCDTTYPEVSFAFYF
jgi:hypothetical protein